MAYPFRDNVRNNFLSLDRLEREEIVALSCFEPAHWERGPAWDIEKDGVEERIMDFMKKLYGKKWKSINNGNPRSIISSSFYGGRMVNDLIGWHIEDKTEYTCLTENDNSKREFDLKICHHGSAKCDVGIKRIVRTGNLSDYLVDHGQKIDDIGEAPTNLLLNLYPTTALVHPERAWDFLVGYGYLSGHIDDRYDKDNYWVANLPASIEPSDDHIKPLQRIEDIIAEKLELHRY